jgi:alkaline phosphatase
VILMISDGFGPSSVTLSRSFHRQWRGRTMDRTRDTISDRAVDGTMDSISDRASWHYRMPLDRMLAGQIQTRSASSEVTDSAAAATAFSCGFKTHNGVIGGTLISMVLCCWSL